MYKKVLYRLLISFAALAYVFLLSISLQKILSGNFAFWYDPARDLLLALDNLHKLTLIGPPAGIPGIFYGPYWIWFLSVALFFLKDPRFVTLLVLCIPYFVIFPYVLWKISKQWGLLTAVILGILFFLNFSEYTTQLWNPHPGPLFFFCSAYLLATSFPALRNRRELSKIFLSGILGGLLINVHISFGIGAMAGIFLFFFAAVLFCLIQAKKKERGSILIRSIISITLFYLGFFLTYLPFFAFEYRHGFHQTQSALKTLFNPYATVGVLGLSHNLILSHFTDVFFTLTRLPQLFLYLFVIIILGNISYFLYKKQKISFSWFDVKIALLAVLPAITLVYFYLTTKNPVWEYHFIGVEVLYLFVIGLILSKLSFVRYVAFVWVCYLLIMRVPAFADSITKPHRTEGTLSAKEQVVKAVHGNTKGNSYGVLVYNPAIYTYDYDYLFSWMEKKSVTKNMTELSPSANPVYMIIPETSSANKQDYINAQTRGVHAKKLSAWQMPDKTTILKFMVVK